MAYGNMNDECDTGEAFSRNPSTGENKFFGGEKDYTKTGGESSCKMIPEWCVENTTELVPWWFLQGICDRLGRFMCCYTRMDLYLMLDIYFPCIDCIEAFSNWEGGRGKVRVMVDRSAGSSAPPC